MADSLAGIALIRATYKTFPSILRLQGCFIVMALRGFMKSLPSSVRLWIRVLCRELHSLEALRVFANAL